MQKLARIIIKYHVVIIAAIVGLTVFFALQFRYVQIQTDVTKEIPPIPQKEYLEEIEQIFGTSGEYAFVGMVASGEEGIFNPRTLRKIRIISRKAKSLPGVDEVFSPTEGDYIRGSEEGIEVIPLVGDEVPESSQKIKEYKKHILGNKMFRGIVCPDGKAAAIMISVNEEADKYALAKNLEKIATPQEGPEKIFVGGKTVIDSAIGNLMIRDLTYLIPVVLGVVVIILYFSFRSLIGVVLPLTTVLISTIWAMGTMILLNIPLSITTFILPILLMAVGTAYGIHILNRYYELKDSEDKSQIVEATLTKVGSAVLIAGLTTIAGFSSLAISEMRGLQKFGLLTAFGIGSALCFSLLFIPSLIMILPKNKRGAPAGVRSGSENPGKVSYLVWFLGRLGRVVYRRKVIILLVTAGIAFFFAAGIPLTSTESNPLLFFPSDNPYRRAEDVLNYYFMGTTPLQVIVKTPHSEGIKEPSVLKKIEKLENYVKDLPHVGGTRSLNEFIKSINKALHEDKEKFYVIPDTRREVAQYLLLYSMSADPQGFEKFVDNQFQTANVMVFLKSGYSAHIKKVIKNVNSFVGENFPPEVKVRVTGEGALFPTINRLLVNTFIRSIILSLILVFIISTTIFRSLTAGMFSLIPIVTAVVINFGVMGWFGIPLNIGTVAISAIAVGIGIDYAVHFISRLTEESAQGPILSALVVTTQTTGKAITYNAIAVSAGFLVLLASSIKWYHFMGGLMSLVMLISAMGALTVLPVAMILAKSRLLKNSEK